MSITGPGVVFAFVAAACGAPPPSPPRDGGAPDSMTADGGVDGGAVRWDGVTAPPLRWTLPACIEAHGVFSRGILSIDDSIEWVEGSEETSERASGELRAGGGRVVLQWRDAFRLFRDGRIDDLVIGAADPVRGALGTESFVVDATSIHGLGRFAMDGMGDPVVGFAIDSSGSVRALPIDEDRWEYDLGTSGGRPDATLVPGPAGGFDLVGHLNVAGMLIETRALYHLPLDSELRLRAPARRIETAHSPNGDPADLRGVLIVTDGSDRMVLRSVYIPEKPGVPMGVEAIPFDAAEVRPAEIVVRAGDGVSSVTATDAVLDGDVVVALVDQCPFDGLPCAALVAEIDLHTGATVRLTPMWDVSGEASDREMFAHPGGGMDIVRQPVPAWTFGEIVENTSAPIELTIGAQRPVRPDSVEPMWLGAGFRAGGVRAVRDGDRIVVLWTETGPVAGRRHDGGRWDRMVIGSYWAVLRCDGR